MLGVTVALVALIGLYLFASSTSDVKREDPTAGTPDNSVANSGKSQPSVGQARETVPKDAQGNAAVGNIQTNQEDGLNESSTDAIDVATPVPTDTNEVGQSSQTTETPDSQSDTEEQDSDDSTPGQASDPIIARFPISKDGVQERIPVPEKSVRQAASADIREVYGADVKKAATLQQKLQLAQRLQRDAVAEDNTAVKYVLMDASIQLAAQAGDGQTVLDFTDKFASQFDVDDLDMKLQSFTAMVNQFKFPPPTHEKLGNTWGGLVQEAIKRDQYGAAESFARLATASARKSSSRPLQRKAASLLKRVATTQTQFDNTQAALEKLEDDPSDPTANLTVGKFCCLFKGDWEKGLPMLALSDDHLLKSAAAKELDPPKSAKAQVELGDAWHAAAEQLTDLEKSEASQRAAHWYRMALPTLTGFAKQKVQQRLGASDDAQQVSKVQDGTIIYAFKAPNALKDFIVEGDFRVSPRGGLELIAGTPRSRAMTRATYTVPIAIEYQVFCAPDGVLDIFPGFAGVSLRLGSNFNKHTLVVIGDQEYKLPHRRLVPNHLYRVRLSVDTKRNLLIRVGDTILFQKQLPPSINLTGPVRLGGGIGHVIYKQVTIKNGK